VIIDVRNAYESAIGHFQPPPGGAELLDPKMRNSHEFPKWINAPETREKLQGKKVMMYCTGGIRCERATALLDQLEKASSAEGGDFRTEGVVMVRGGIERYVKTFPEGGFWKVLGPVLTPQP
jgi:predicted sulfurtransferase